MTEHWFSKPFGERDHIMAILRNDHLSLEIVYSYFDSDWIHYDIWCRWRDVPILNPALFSNDHLVPPDRKGIISACDLDRCSLLPLLHEAIHSRKSGVWYSLPPAVAIAVYANEISPFDPEELEESISSRRSLSSSDPDLRSTRALRGLKRPIEILVGVDTGTFNHSDGYSEEGACFRLLLTSEQLRTFYEDLRAEYDTFCREHEIDAYLRDRRNTDD